MAGSPVLVGALTTLVVIVAVFLSYNANQGLPFVPTYDLNAKLPNAAQLVQGNEVRMGGFRVGVISTIKPVRQANGTSYAEVQMKLQKNVEPLPVDSQLVVRPRSALGLKYIQITQGSSHAGFQNGDTMPLSAANPRPVEFDEVLNMFDERTRTGEKRTLTGLGNGLAGRGQDLNEVIQLLPPLFSNLQPVAQNLADPRTRLARFFPSIARAASIVAPAAQTQADLFANLDTTFTALSSVARPFIQDTISKSPPTLDTAISNFPQQRPFLRNTAGLMRELRPGVAVLPATLPDLADALELGTPALKRTPALNKRLEGVFTALQEFATDPLVPVGIRRLNDTVTSLYPTLRFLLPVQTTCNYATLWFRNVSSVLSEGDKFGTWQRFIIVATPQGPNSESGPSSAPANGPTPENKLRTNPYPWTASPGQPKSCAAGNENFPRNAQAFDNKNAQITTKTDGQVP
jgi:virulence factor Mce-like protein